MDLKSKKHLILCHRKPERTFKIKGHYFPVCARCTGLYSGSFIFVAFFLYMGKNNISKLVSDYKIILISIAITAPTFIDGITQLFGKRESTNFIRFTTGIFAGFGLCILVIMLKIKFLKFFASF